MLNISYRAANYSGGRLGRARLISSESLTQRLPVSAFSNPPRWALDGDIENIIMVFCEHVSWAFALWAGTSVCTWAVSHV